MSLLIRFIIGFWISCCIGMIAVVLWEDIL